MTIDYIILEIERAWAKTPGWFASLPRDDQILLLAHRRVQMGA